MLQGNNPTYTLRRCTAEAEARAFVIAANLKRRHLDEGQRGLVAARFATMPVGKPPNQANLPNNGGPTVAEAAVAPLRPSDCAPRSTRRCFRKSGRGSPLLPFCYQTR